MRSISDRTAAADKAAVKKWELSPRERELQRALVRM